MFYMQDQEVKEDDYLEIDPETNESDKPQAEDDNFYFRWTGFIDCGGICKFTKNNILK